MAIILIRTIIVYFFIILSLRLMGKRQLGELELSELVVALLISDLAANPLQESGIPLLNGLLPVAVLLCCEVILSGCLMKSLRFRALVCGKPSMLVENGVIQQDEMRRNRFTLDELTEELRMQGIMDISKIQYAVLETDGQLNIVLFPAEQPLTPAQMGIAVPDSGYTTIIINDGKVIEQNLKVTGHNRAWLEKELKKRGGLRPERVYILTVNGAGEIYYLPMEDKK